jgi:hypothetical protein
MFRDEGPRQHHLQQRAFETLQFPEEARDSVEQFALRVD